LHIDRKNGKKKKARGEIEIGGEGRGVTRPLIAKTGRKYSTQMGGGHGKGGKIGEKEGREVGLVWYSREQNVKQGTGRRGKKTDDNGQGPKGERRARKNQDPLNDLVIAACARKEKLQGAAGIGFGHAERRGREGSIASRV